MPLATIASAVSRTRASLQLPANVFQVFQPMGGVRASPSNFSALALGEARAAQARRQDSLFIRDGGLGFLARRPAAGGLPNVARRGAKSSLMGSRQPGLGRDFGPGVGGQPGQGSFAWISLLAAAKSINGASGVFFRAPITLPISLREVAPDSAMAAAISASRRTGSIPLGRYFSRSRISVSLARTRSGLPPLSNSALASARF